MVGSNRSCTSKLPPGFRFHPTDEELIIHYLRNQASSMPCPVSIIPQLDIYKFDPWHLPDKAGGGGGEKEWYFFTTRERKYPNGARPNRAAVSGYWKATGTDKAIYSGSNYVGVKKSLVFYEGKPPKGVKTNWIMHEYRLSDHYQRCPIPYKGNTSMRLEDWVLCRIYKKKNLQLGSRIHTPNPLSCQDDPHHLSSSPFPHQTGSCTADQFLPQPYNKPLRNIAFSNNYSLSSSATHDLLRHGELHSSFSHLLHYDDDTTTLQDSASVIKSDEGFLLQAEEADDDKKHRHQLGHHMMQQQQFQDKNDHQTMFLNIPIVYQVNKNQGL